MKRIFLIRHCKANGQSKNSSLTEEGLADANKLHELFIDVKIDRIISSPYKRTVETIWPLSQKLKVDIELEKLLEERVLSTKDLPDWKYKLKQTFIDPNLSFEGGESSAEATKRIVKVLERVFLSEANSVILVTHGNLMALGLRYINRRFDFEDWENLTNPDVYLIEYKDHSSTTYRLWKG